MNQMYLNDIDLMKFEHSIRSDLDMFMIECYEDYYYEAEAKEGIFQKIKRKIKEIFEKLKAIFRGNKVKQMDANIKEAEKAVQQMPSEQKNEKVEVFDGEKALKLIEEDHEKAKKDPNHKRLDKKKLIALCTIPVTIAVAVGILIKNRKTLPKILDKEKELNKEVEQAEKRQEQVKKEVQKQQEQVKKEAEKRQEQVKKEVQKQQEQVKAPTYQGSAIITKHKDKRTEWENDQISKMNNSINKRESDRKEAMSQYRSNMRTNGRKIRLDRRYTKYCFDDIYKPAANPKEDFEYKYNPNDDLKNTHISNISKNNKDRFKILVSSVTNETTGLYVGEYTLIIDTVNKTAKEIVDLYNTSQPRLKSHIDKIDISFDTDNIDKLNYHSNILNRDVYQESLATNIV